MIEIKELNPILKNEINLSKGVNTLYHNLNSKLKDNDKRNFLFVMESTSDITILKFLQAILTINLEQKH